MRRIQAEVAIPRERMTDSELTVHTFASDALTGGEPVITVFARGLGARMCRICLAEGTIARAVHHVAGCPAGHLS